MVGTMTYKDYRHVVTGIEVSLDEDFASVFGDVFEPVTKTARKSTKKTGEENSSPTDTSSKEGND